MGCDIAIYIEEKDYLGNWKEVEVHPNSILPEERYYDVWAFLFNVRNGEYGNPKYKDPVFPVRGIPTDCSMKDIIEDFENIYSDWHSWSYLYYQEVEKIEWPDEMKDCYFRIFLENVFPVCQTSVCNEVRMIVCFHC
jgi:hypothetical protein